jgi:type I restriction-modification system DNA methylase subunit
MDTLSIKRIGLQETVSMLGVSSATVKNWIRHNYITFQEKRDGQIFFNYNEIDELKGKISNGTIDRLNGRANKRHSNFTFIPSEYIENQEVVSEIEDIVRFVQEKDITPNLALFLLSLNLLKSEGLIFDENLEGLLKLEDITFKYRNIETEIKSWLWEFSNLKFENSLKEIFLLKIPKINDVLGVIYQSLSLEGEKAKKGSYYTPKAVVDNIVDLYLNKAKEDILVLDPCCGTGQFLLSASEKIGNPENVWGFDLDKLATRIAKINLFVKFKNLDFVPKIFEKNTLLDISDNSLFSKKDTPEFDLIITNPPWGVHFSSLELSSLQQKYKQIKSLESFSYFIKAGLDLLKKNGILSFILPESILNIKVHADIREIILKNSQIVSIAYLDRVFKNVFTSVIRLDIKKSEIKENKFIARKDNTNFEVQQNRLLNNSDFTFDVFSQDIDLEIIKKIYNTNHTTLKNQAEWALGIVTGNNGKFLSTDKLPDYEPIFTGKEVGRYIVKNQQNYIKFEPNKFQQTAPEAKYRAKEKLIYKFISKYLVFAYDDKQRLTLNSANILIPKITDYPVKVILALFNSSLYQFIFEKKIRAIKLLRADLEKLPLPIWGTEVISYISEQVDQILTISDKEKKQNIYENLDTFIMQQCGLKDKEIFHIKENINMPRKLLLN